ncbi:hypothetical protein PLICRDRAFT_180273 [Plicaturopsis crispa FD-325 SS-3]|uniref:Zn(2)-C6 fungal-type domain-containing protein n=1 Tax=Plicaturopsis crispa FD-325 SS-3 TaxID=944288 RepID=A0A0C9SQE8_PLICR|nr:hypothetical protein PLICRDRAFT_180273 [Plicaturopsis crispa FD-325 SS-3]
MSSSPNPGPAPADASTSAGGKEKKTRRRLRVSCVECAKRRQKCDRQQPCALCVSRNVAHLCRWDSVPMARPAPARPPRVPAAERQQLETATETIRVLTERVAQLEESLARHQTLELEGAPESFGAEPSRTSHETSIFSQHDPGGAAMPDDGGSSERPQDSDVSEIASALAQFTLSEYDGEYMGQSTIISTMGKLGDIESPTCAPSTNDTIYRKTAPTPSDQADPVAAFLANLPEWGEVQGMLRTFFARANWRFGIPERWFRAACERTWHIRDRRPTASGGGSTVNINWLCLLFAVLTVTPPASASTPSAHTLLRTEFFFSQAEAAAYSVRPSLKTEGTVLSCLATPLLAMYLADRSKKTAAWKVLGWGIRNAQAVGMHCDPHGEGWRMSAEEAMLRARGWLLSFLLGRPAMVQSSLFNVPQPKPGGSGSDEDGYDTFQLAFVQLSDIIGSACETCFGTSTWLSPEQVANIDLRLEQWDARLPLALRWTYHSPSTPYAPALQAYTLATWHLAARMNLHRMYRMQFIRPRAPVLLPAHAIAASCAHSRATCLELARTLIRMRADPTAGVCTDAHGGYDILRRHFEQVFFLVDAAVTLIGWLGEAGATHDHEQYGEAEELVGNVLNILEHPSRPPGGAPCPVADRTSRVIRTMWRRVRDAEQKPRPADADAGIVGLGAAQFLDVAGFWAGDPSVLGTYRSGSPLYSSPRVGAYGTSFSPPVVDIWGDLNTTGGLTLEEASLGVDPTMSDSEVFMEFLRTGRF